jgi:hypothetical protein
LTNNKSHKKDPELFQLNAAPELWTNGPEDPTGLPQLYAFGFWCGDLLCLIPLEGDVSEERRKLWQSPICQTEEDAKRIWFLVKQLMLALETP